MNATELNWIVINVVCKMNIPIQLNWQIRLVKYLIQERSCGTCEEMGESRNSVKLPDCKIHTEIKQGL